MLYSKSQSFNFSSLSFKAQDFLIKSSVFDVVRPYSWEDFGDIHNAPEILEDLARRNLFIQSMYDQQKGWSYRYHQLFRDFLQAKLRRVMGKAQQVHLFLQAAQSCEREGELEQAVKYYLQGADYHHATAIIEAIGMDLIKRGKTGDLLQWLQSMPKDLIMGNPSLLFYYYMVRRLTGSAELILDLKRALALFQQQGDLRGSFLAMAYLLEALIIRGHPPFPIFMIYWPRRKPWCKPPAPAVIRRNAPSSGFRSALPTMCGAATPVRASGPARMPTCWPGIWGTCPCKSVP